MKWAFWSVGPLASLLPAVVQGSVEMSSFKTSQISHAFPWTLSVDDIKIMATGMVFALVVYNFCILVRALKRSYLEYCLYGMLLGLYLFSRDYELSHHNTVLLLSWPLPSYLFLLCAVTAAIQFQLSLLQVRHNSQALWTTLMLGRWTTLILASLALANITALRPALEQWTVSLVMFISILLAAGSLRLLLRGDRSAAFFVTGWFSLALGLLGSELYFQTHSSPLLKELLALSISIGAVIQAIANSLALPAFTSQRYRMYQKGYELMENNLQRQHNQRRVYNDAVRQYLHNIPNMDEQSVGTRLLEVLNNLLPLETSIVVSFRDEQMKVIAQTFNEQNYFERMLGEQQKLLENLARHGQISSLPPLPNHESGESLNVVPVYWDHNNWILVIMQPLPGTALEADHLQLSLDISSHACTLFMASNNYRKLQHEADADSLTGILNRRAFLREARTVIRRLQESNQSLGLLYLDIDLFKPLNDNHGHAFGDHVLKQFAEVCRDNLRERDLLARIGGEEFIVLLPQATMKSAIHIAERIRKGLASLTFSELEGRPVTVSIGVADSVHSGYELRHLMARADRALYRAKAEGRNRTVTVTDLVIGP